MGFPGQQPLPLIPIRQVALALGGSPVTPPDGMVYSTGPTSWTDADGVDRIVKGPDVGMVVAEALGYLLGRRVGLRVPDFAIATIESIPGLHFASEKLVRAQRDVSPWLRLPTFREAFARVVLFDVWVVNHDRNHGGFLADEHPETGALELVAIDFEKSVALRGPQPIVTTPTIAVGRLRPQGELGPLLHGLPIPAAGIAGIKGVTSEEMEGAVGALREVVGASYDWGDSTVHVLEKRRDRIEALAAEVWG